MAKALAESTRCHCLAEPPTDSAARSCPRQTNGGGLLPPSSSGETHIEITNRANRPAINRSWPHGCSRFCRLANSCPRRPIRRSARRGSISDRQRRTTARNDSTKRQPDLIACQGRFQARLTSADDSICCGSNRCPDYVVRGEKGSAVKYRRGRAAVKGDLRRAKERHCPIGWEGGSAKP